MGTTLTDGSGLILMDEDGKPDYLETDHLKTIFDIFKNRNLHFKLILLNACYSDKQAKVLAEYADYVIGTTEDVGINNANEFAKMFYNDLAAGNSIPDAFEIAKATSKEFSEKAILVFIKDNKLYVK
jgi:hypothetical protein